MQVGVIGIGVMGSQIAANCAIGGHDVMVWDPNHTAAKRKQIERVLRRVSRQQRNNAGVTTLRRGEVEPAQSLADFAPCEILLESVPENFHTKREVYQALRQYVGNQAVVASNTSALSITKLADTWLYPEQFIGIHFFNPVDAIDLVEVGRGPKTTDAVVEKTIAFVRSLGKEPSVMPDIPGFIVNHLLMMMVNTAIHLMEDEGLDPTLIDQAMRLGARHPLGPLELADLIGLDVCLASLENLHEATGNEAYRPASLLRQLVKQNRLGRKVGNGIHCRSAKKVA